MKTEIDFIEFCRRIKKLQLPEVDLVVGIGTGGIIPASIIAFHLGLDLRYITIQFRDRENNILFREPEVIELPKLPSSGLHILLVDEVSVSGKTMEKAKEILSGNKITTLVCKGKADFILFPEISQCVFWPWKH